MDRNRRGSLTQFQAGRTLGRGPREGGRLTGRRTKAAGEKAERGSPGRWPIRKGGDLSGSGRVAEGGGDRARARARPGVRGSAIGQPVPRRSGGTRYRGTIRHNQYCAKSPQSRTKRIAWRIRPTRTEACWDRDDGRWKGGGSWRGAKPARTSSHGTMRDEERRGKDSPWSPSLCGRSVVGDRPSGRSPEAGDGATGSGGRPGRRVRPGPFVAVGNDGSAAVDGGRATEPRPHRNPPACSPCELPGARSRCSGAAAWRGRSAAIAVRILVRRPVRWRSSSRAYPVRHARRKTDESVDGSVIVSWEVAGTGAQLGRRVSRPRITVLPGFGATRGGLSGPGPSGG
jgi:hypothetical protein